MSITRYLFVLLTAFVPLTLSGQPSSQTHISAADCLTRPVDPGAPAIARLVAAVDNLLRRGEVDAALSLITTDIASHPSVSVLEDARGRVLYRLGDLLPAIDAINLASRLDPCDSRAHYDAWRILATAGQFQSAQHQLDLAHLIAPSNAQLQRVWTNTQLPLPAGVVADDPPHFDFYARHLDCDGIPVRAAAVVNPAALPAACAHIRSMLAHIPNVRANLIARGAELHISGEDQVVSDLPEYRAERGERKFLHRGDKDPTHPKIDIDSLAGALGSIYATCPEANVLHLPRDGYGPHNEVCVHEFGHDIMNAGFDAGQRDAIDRIYKSSTAKGLWKGAYAATNPNEFWAEITVWYFGFQGGIHGMEAPIPEPGPDALRAYDPDAFALADRFYTGQKQPKVIHPREARQVNSTGGYRGNNLPAELLFINNTAGRRQVYFVDRNGEPHDFGILEPYSRKAYRCYTDEFWLVFDPRTGTKTLFSIQDDVATATINEPPPPKANSTRP